MKRRTRLLTTFATTASLLVMTTACGTSTSHTTTNSNQTNQTGPQTTKFPITVTDDTGAKVTINTKPVHIASGTEGTDEILTSLVPKSHIALVTSLSSNPTYSNVVTQVKGIPQMTQADAEKIISVKPDLVFLASYVKPGVVKQVQNAGIPVYEFNDFNSVTDIEKNIKVIGRLVGETTKAQALVNNMQNNIQKVRTAVKGESQPTVLDYGSFGYAGGKNTTSNDIIQLAGGKNAAASLNGWAKISDEELVKLNPDVIIDSASDKAFLDKLAKEPALQSVSAIKHHRLYAIPDADLTSVSQYVVKGIVDVARDIHPNVKLPNIQILQ